MSSNKPKIVFVSESIRRDSHAPLRYLRGFKVVHFYLKAPYKDMTKEDFKGSWQVSGQELFEKIINEKPVIIQGVEPFGSRVAFYLAYICYKAARATRAKLVVPVLENRPVAERFNLWQRFFLRLFCPILFKQAAAVVTLNNGAVRNVKSYYKDAKIKRGIIWGVWGVDLDLFRPVGPREHGKIIFVGRLIEDKGLRYLVEGFKMASRKLPYLHLQLVGQGPYEKELRDYVKKEGLERQVDFAGAVPNTELPRYFSSAEIAAYLSITMKRWEEQVGTVNFQALACGTVVLTAKSGAIPEYIKEGEGAILVRERSSSAIEKAILKFYNNRTFRRRLFASTLPASKNFDIKGEISKAEKLFEEILLK
ncbi:MAG: glycosyltransferase family 4 protein [Candidatus Berkelbacteria bacterium]|nr:glycosyltransferase family 4 protein [Candidatus Berkelbacteria bacterium]